MLISYTHKFIFIHVYHTAGTSIKEVLKEYAIDEPESFKIKRPLKKLEDSPNLIYNMWYSVVYHAKAKEIKKEFAPELYDNFYKFAFVRNPWDRLVSSYHHLLKDTWDLKHKIVKSMESFDEFVDWSVKKNNCTQKDFITDDKGQLIVDFVGRYESLEEDFSHICKILKIDINLPRKNHTNHKDYKTYYSERTKKIVEELFLEDIELFGYTFDGYSVGELAHG
jgi:hypothetical protein